MTNAVSEKKQRADWRSMLAAPTGAPVALAAVLYAASALILPFADAESAALGYCLSAAVFYYLLCRAFLPMLALGVPAFLLFALGNGSFLLPASFLAVLLGGASAAFLCLHIVNGKRLWPLALLPVAAWGAAFLISGDALRALLTLLPLGLGITAGLCLLLFLPHTDSVLAGTFVLAASLLLAGLLTAVAMGRDVGTLLPDVADAVHRFVTSLFTEAADTYAEAGISLGMDDVTVANTAAQTVNLLPALFGVACLITSYLTYRVALRLLVCFGTIPVPPLRISALHISPVAAGLFIVAFFVGLIGNADHATYAGVVGENLALLLEPALVLAGFSALFGKRQRACLSELMALALLFVLWSNPSMGLALAAFYGALTILSAFFFPPGNDEGES